MCSLGVSHAMRYVRHARGRYAYPVRTVRGALGASRPAPPVRTERGRLARVACTYPTEAPGRTCTLRPPPTSRQAHGLALSPTLVPSLAPILSLSLALERLRMSAYGPAASLGQARDTCQLRCSRVRRLLRKTASCSVDIGDRRASADWVASAVGDVLAEAGSAFTEVNVVVGARMSCGERLGERRPSACNTCVTSSSCPSSAPVAASAVASASAGVDAIEKRGANQVTTKRTPQKVTRGW